MFSNLLIIIFTTLAEEKIILGIDPGTTIMGYGLIECEGKNKIKLLTLGVIQLSKYDNQPLKLKKIFERVLGLIEEFKPDELAIEAPFFGKNVQSMLKLGRAQGVAMAAALFKEIPIFEYAPRKVKQSVTGNGNASKEQVSEMMKNILKEKLDEAYFDATDALAVAVCHYYQNSIPGSASKSSGWKTFIAQNPDRIK